MKIPIKVEMDKWVEAYLCLVVMTRTEVDAFIPAADIPIES